MERAWRDGIGVVSPIEKWYDKRKKRDRLQPTPHTQADRWKSGGSAIV
ncbi:hypothetical protein [Paenibacillus abyssi]|nr:hypothetical protein [Paenibacillus abyssi]